MEVSELDKLGYSTVISGRKKFVNVRQVGSPNEKYVEHHVR